MEHEGKCRERNSAMYPRCVEASALVTAGQFLARSPMLAYDAANLGRNDHCPCMSRKSPRSPKHLGYRLLCLLRSCEIRTGPSGLQ
jgi:hypothetical protein